MGNNLRSSVLFGGRILQSLVRHRVRRKYLLSNQVLSFALFQYQSAPVDPHLPDRVLLLLRGFSMRLPDSCHGPLLDRACLTRPCVGVRVVEIKLHKAASCGRVL